MVGVYGVNMASDLMQKARNEAINYTAAAALRHAADCIDELVEKGEPMGSHQTFRRGYNAADRYVVDSELSGDDFDEGVDKVGDVAGMALDHDISGKDAATFYRNQADELEN
jgi:hypothetical protein